MKIENKSINLKDVPQENKSRKICDYETVNRKTKFRELVPLKDDKKERLSLPSIATTAEFHDFSNL